MSHTWSFSEHVFMMVMWY